MLSSDSPGLKKNSIQHFFKKIAPTPESPDSSKIPKGSDPDKTTPTGGGEGERTEPSTPVSSRLFGKKRRRVRVIESDSDSDVSIDFNDSDQMEKNDSPKDVDEQDCIEEPVCIPETTSSKPELDSPETSAKAGVKNAFTMMMMKRKEKTSLHILAPVGPEPSGVANTTKKASGMIKSGTTMERVKSETKPALGLKEEPDKSCSAAEADEAENEKFGLEKKENVGTDNPMQPIKVLLETPSRKFKVN